MALSAELRSVAEGLLERVPTEELRALIEVLQYFNEKCRESDRSGCLQFGSSQPDDEEERLREVYVAKSANIYLTAPRPVCRCCGR